MYHQARGRQSPWNSNLIMFLHKWVSLSCFARVFECKQACQRALMQTIESRTDEEHRSQGVRNGPMLIHARHVHMLRGAPRSPEHTWRESSGPSFDAIACASRPVVEVIQVWHPGLEFKLGWEMNLKHLSPLFSPSIFRTLRFVCMYICQAISIAPLYVAWMVPESPFVSGAFSCSHLVKGFIYGI